MLTPRCASGLSRARQHLHERTLKCQPEAQAELCNLLVLFDPAPDVRPLQELQGA